MSSSHNPNEVLDTIRKWLLTKHAKPDGPWLFECRSHEDMFAAGIKKDNPIRFYLPRCTDDRCTKYSAEKDCRQVRLEYTDTTQYATFEMQADGLVVDDSFGTIGLIQLCGANAASSGNTDLMHAFVLQAVREAVGLRHELLRRCKDNDRPYFVELVLVVTTIDAGQIAAIGQVLRTIMTHSEYLHNIGVNIVSSVAKSDDIGISRSFDKAFCWLLPNVRKWYLESKEIPLKPSDSKSIGLRSQLKELILTDFRIAGERSWMIDEKQRLHLVHGLNGTGKSSLVESLELLLTNRVERIERGGANTDYAGVLTYSGTKTGDASPASLKAILTGSERNSKATVTGHVESNGMHWIEAKAKKRTAKDESDALLGQFKAWRDDKALTADSFRLEQSAADRLSQSGPAERADVLLKAFFPDVDRSQKERLQFTAEIKATAAELRQQLGYKTMTDGSLPWLDSLADEVNIDSVISQALEWTGAFEKKKLELSDILKLYHPDPGQLEKTLEQVAPEILKELADELQSEKKAAQRTRDAALNRINERLLEAVSRDASQAKAYSICLEVLDPLLQWTSSSETIHGGVIEFQKYVDRWLESHVQADLFRRGSEILGTKEDWGGSLLVDEILSPIKKGQSDRVLRYQALREELESNWNTVSQFRTDQAQSVRRTFRPEISPSSLAICDSVIASEPPFSQVVRRALAENRSQSGVHESTTYMIGSSRDSGLDTIRDSIAMKLEQSQWLAKTELRRVSRLSTVIETTRELNLKCNQLKATEEALAGILLTQLNSNEAALPKAINELLSLFTPARWAYSDVDAAGKFDSSSRSLDLKIGNNVASQILNTAELNTLALTFFLLCAPRVHNPIRMLVLDDPFQNMDELTITTVARGLIRLLDLWKSFAEDEYLSGLNLAIFMHSADDVKRFQQEGACQLYRLPWLLPDDTKDEGSNVISVNSKTSETRAIPTLKLVAIS